MSWLRGVARSLSGKRYESPKERLARLQEARFQANVRRRSRVDELEDELARATLFIQTLIEACLKRGVFSREELQQVAREVDLLDGVADGRLDPSALESK